MSGWRNDPIKSTGFDAQIKHEDGYELHFYTDRLEAYRAVEKVCQEQIDRKPKTHGDELRDMTDEELAKMFFLHDDQVYRHCPSDTLAEYCEVKLASECCDCDKCWLDWLKQEVSDNG